ncbi:hypothetical protein L873DRAFT_402135 [Choiromyces venosus 120613-1]|uniref:Uncharacterized protein n=1 Tax=Choiromyces venosus 120613-1 TaxID=1336337 RepID=A0A3N4IWL4_9PEZI|nr:hypothetical protein L873DRAFT_402135 [Choiromyces venosus 120613-1]
MPQWLHDILLSEWPKWVNSIIDAVSATGTGNISSMIRESVDIGCPLTPERLFFLSLKYDMKFTR